MPHVNLKLIPGVDQNRTEALNEAAIWKSNLIRFVPDRQGQGLPQKLGGWEKFISTAPWNSTVTALHAWSDLSANCHLGIGTNNSIWQSTDASTPNLISPQYYMTDLSISIRTVSGSADVVVTDTGSNISSYDSVYIMTPISVNGIILFGLYSCKRNPLGPANSYILSATNIIGVPTPATATNVFNVTTIATTGSSPNFIATVNFTPAEIIPVGTVVTFTGAGSFTTGTVAAGSAAGVFTMNTGTTNYGSASAGTFITSLSTFGAVPTFTSTSAPSSPTITVTLANHGYSVGSTFSVQVSTTVGTVPIYGDYIVTSVPSTSTFTISASSAPTSAVTVAMNDGKARVIYYIGQQSLPPTGYGAGGYGYFGYGNNVDPSASSGRQYTGTTVSTAGGVTTVTIPNTWVNIPVGTTVQDTASTPNTFTVTASTTPPPPSGTDSTFTFTGTPTGTTFNVFQWGFVMPGASDVATFDPDWSLDNWGEYLIASPHMGEIFFWQPAQNDGRLAVIPNAPSVNEGFFVAMPERQIVAYGSTFTGFQDPMLVRWCDIGNFTSWIGTVVNQAGSYRIPKGSKIIGGIQGPQQGLLWTDLGLWSMQYVNLPLVYSFNEIASGCGLVGRKAAGTMGGIVYWMSQSQFFKLSGNGVEPIECPIWDVIFQDVDQNYWENVRCAPNSRFGEITWYYPVLNTDGTKGDGIPKKYVKYNTLLNQWDFGTLTRTAWIDQSVNGAPIGAGGDYAIYQHEVSATTGTLYNDGDNAMTSYFQTGYFSVQEGDLKTFLDQVWPDMKWGLYDNPNQNATVTITFYTADYPGDTPMEYSYTVTKNTQFVTPRFRARLVSIKIESSDLDSFWRLGNIRYRYQPDGKF
jgi:hypothetical protein